MLLNKFSDYNSIWEFSVFFKFLSLSSDILIRDSYLETRALYRAALFWLKLSQDYKARTQPLCEPTAFTLVCCHTPNSMQF